MRRSSNCSSWRCATSRRNGPCRCTTGRLRSTASPSSTKIGCRLNSRETNRPMKQRHKKPGYGNGGKTNCVFPPFPQPLLLPTNYDKKQRPKNNNDRLHKILDATLAQPGL